MRFFGWLHFAKMPENFISENKDANEDNYIKQGGPAG
jgi:hypothetical protein